MKKYSVRLASAVGNSLRHFHPGLKRKIRRALEELERDPFLGKPLKEQLHGLCSYRVTQYRIIYRINRSEILIQAVETAPRKIVYEKVLDWMS